MQRKAFGYIVLTAIYLEIINLLSVSLALKKNRFYFVANQNPYSQ